MPTWAAEIIQTYGPGAFVSVIVALAVFFLTKAFSQQMNADANKDVTMTGFAVKFDDERRQWQERHDKLQEEFTTFRIEQAKKEGGLEVLEKMLTHEREERRVERDGFEDKLRKLDTRVQEVEKNNQQGLDRIQTLETERDEKIKIIAERDARILILGTDNLEKTTKIEHLTNKANTLSELVERLQVISTPSPTNNVQPIPVKGDVTQPIPPMGDVDDTLIPDIPSAVTTAEETKP